MDTMMEPENSNLICKELNVERCILELVINSLKSKCTAVAVRFGSKERKIQVVDNGNGISKKELLLIFDSCHGDENNEHLSNILTKIGYLSESIILTSRSQSSDETFVIVHKKCGTKFMRGVHRPSTGTTVTINNFNLQTWNQNSDNKNSSIAFIIAALALAHLQVSFSLRNNDENNVIIRIRRPHSPWSVLKFICGKKFINLRTTCYYLKHITDTFQDFTLHGYLGFVTRSKRNVQCLFYNHKLISCPQNIQNEIIQTFMKISDKKNKFDANQVFYLLYIYNSCHRVEESCEVIANNMKPFDSKILLKLISDYVKTLDHTKSTQVSINETMSNLLESAKTLTNSSSNKLSSPFSDWSNWSYNLMSNTNTVQYKDNIILSQLSNWSNWSYHPKDKDNPTSNTSDIVFSCTQSKIHCANQRRTIKRYNFLPSQLQNFLPYTKILHRSFVTKQSFKTVTDNDSELMEKVLKRVVYHKEILDVKSCKSKTHREVRLTSKSIRLMKVLSQVNSEFIAAVTVHNKNKLLLLVDQHAIHERIRYESLLEKHRIGQTYEYTSMRLYEPVLINDLDKNTIRLLFANKKVLYRFGLHVRSWEGHGFLVTSVPACFIKGRSTSDNEQLICRIRKLLSEISDGLKESCGVALLPASINDCIASEACHGAIKFGDPLTQEDCQTLVESLQNTKAPLRCAHGRPSIVPILELTSLNKCSTKIRVRMSFIK